MKDEIETFNKLNHHPNILKYLGNGIDTYKKEDGIS